MSETVKSIYGSPIEDTEARSAASANAHEISQLSEEKVDKNGTGQISIENLAFAKGAGVIKSKNLINPNDPDWATDGKLISSGAISNTPDTTLDTTGYIPVDGGSAYILSARRSDKTARDVRTGTSRFAAYDYNKNYISGSYMLDSSAVYYTPPENASYIRVCIDKTIFTDWMLEAGTEITEYEPYSETEMKYVIPKEYIELPKIDVPTKLSDLDNDEKFISLYQAPLALPSTMYAFVGQPIRLYFGNMMDYAPDDVYIRMTTGNKGVLKKRLWEYTPDAAQNLPIKFFIFDHAYRALNDGEQRQIVVKDASVKPSLTVLVIGDSTVNEHVETQTMLELADADGYPLTLLGTRGEEGSANQHEGRGGWTAEMYVNLASNTNGRVQNAFYNPESETFDFAYYMQSQGYTNVDCVFIQLGINDLFSAKTDDELKTLQDTYFANMDAMVASIHAYDPEIKLVINTVIPCDTDQDKFSESYPMNQTVWRNHHNVYLSNLKIIEHFEGMENVYVSWYCAALDCDNNMRGDVHPNADGYAQLGTQMYSFMRAIN